MGNTGRGLNVRRAHLHLELNLQLSNNYQSWHKRRKSNPNYHDNFNGINLAGIDIAGFYLRNKQKKTSIKDFIARKSPYCQVSIASSKKPEIANRYPWLYQNPQKIKTPNSWNITLSRSGIPLAIEPSQSKLSSTSVTHVQYNKTNHSLFTRYRITGVGSKASLTKSGHQYIELLCN